MFSRTHHFHVQLTRPCSIILIISILLKESIFKNKKTFKIYLENENYVPQPSYTYAAGLNGHLNFNSSNISFMQWHAMQ